MLDPDVVFAHHPRLGEVAETAVDHPLPHEFLHDAGYRWDEEVGLWRIPADATPEQVEAIRFRASHAFARAGATVLSLPATEFDGPADPLARAVERDAVRTTPRTTAAAASLPPTLPAAAAPRPQRS